MQHPSIGSRHIRLLAFVIFLLMAQAFAILPLLPLIGFAGFAAPYLPALIAPSLLASAALKGATLSSVAETAMATITSSSAAFSPAQSAIRVMDGVLSPLLTRDDNHNQDVVELISTDEFISINTNSNSTGPSYSITPAVIFTRDGTTLELVWGPIDSPHWRVVTNAITGQGAIDYMNKMYPDYSDTLDPTDTSWLIIFETPIGDVLTVLDIAEAQAWRDMVVTGGEEQNSQPECYCLDPPVGGIDVIEVAKAVTSLLLYGLGFTNGGVRAGSFGAGMMAAHGDVPKGSFVSRLQSWGTRAFSPGKAGDSLLKAAHQGVVQAYNSKCTC